MKLVMFAICIIFTEAGLADIVYTNQERFISVTLTDGTQRIDATDFSPFNEYLNVSGPDSSAQSLEDSTLGATAITANCLAHAHSGDLLGFAQAQCRLYVEFDLAGASPFVLDGRFHTNSADAPIPFAHLRFSGPTGDIVDFEPLRDDTIDFSGENAVLT